MRIHLSSLLFITLLVATAIASHQNAPTLTLSIALLAPLPTCLIVGVARGNPSPDRAKEILIGVTLLVAFYIGSIGPYAAIISAVPDEHFDSNIKDSMLHIGLWLYAPIEFLDKESHAGVAFTRYILDWHDIVASRFH